jgi:hypothetical protein
VSDFWPGAFGRSSAPPVGIVPETVTAFLLMNRPIRALALVSDFHAFLAGDVGYLIQITPSSFGRIAVRTTASVRGVAYADGLLAYVAADGTVDTLILPPDALVEVTPLPPGAE